MEVGRPPRSPRDAGRTGTKADRPTAENRRTVRKLSRKVNREHDDPPRHVETGTPRPHSLC